MQVSHSRIDCFHQCPRKFRLRYLDGLKTIPDDKPDNPLYLGTALHTGLEIGVQEAIRQYYANYPIITDDHINESIKLEIMIRKAQQIVPKGQNEVLIENEDFKGFIDLLVPVESNGMLKTFDLYDFKYSNNVQNYLESDQLHLYKYFFEKQNPLCTIRNMYFLMVPKSKCKQIKGEDLTSYRRRLINDCESLKPELCPIAYDPNKVIQFLINTKHMMEERTFPKRRQFLCQYCEFYEYCIKGESYMLLPENKRRSIQTVTKKVIWIYGAPFSGKTTFANAFPDPIMLNTDGNIKFVDAPYIAIKDVVQKIDRRTERKMAWEIFKEAIDELEVKQNSFKTIVVDLLEDTYEACRRYVCDQKGWDHESDDSFRAWDMVRKEFLDTLKRLMGLDYENIVLISHLDTTMDVTKKGGDKLTKIKPNINDKIANKIAGMVDIVARCIADDNQYVLSFKRNEVIFGGGRLKFRSTEIPLDYSAFCGLYEDLMIKGTVTPSNNEKPVGADSFAEESPSEGTNAPEAVIESVTDDRQTPTESTPEKVDNEPAPVRRRKRRTEE